MSVLGFGQGQQYGMNTVVYEFQSAFMWNGPFSPVFWNANIAAGTVDAGNSPTTVLRMGLLMGRQTATGLWTNYVATNTDGSEVAQGILTIGFNMTNFLTGQTQPLFWGVCVGGCVKSSQLIGLDGMARDQLSKQFLFDDDLPGRPWFPFRRFQNKIANYQIVAATDNGTEFNNMGQPGGIAGLTLPPIANGLMFGMRCQAAAIIRFVSYEGSVLGQPNNIIGNGSLVNGSVSANTIGGGVRIYSNPSATYWEVSTTSSSGTGINYP